ncbi:MAG: tyrosine-type recombinase/integrase [bacterium]
MTFAELGQRYLDYAGRRLKSHDRLKSFVNTLNKYFGNKRLDDFSMLTVENMQSDIIKKGLSVAYTNRLTAVLKRMFVKASDWELITEDDLKRIRKVKLLKGEVKRLRYLADDEAERLISNCDNYLKPIVITALNTGMRKSEILNLTWDRVDMLNRVILLDTTKNGERREIPINDNLYESLSGIVRRINVKHVFFNPRTVKPYNDIKKGFSAALGKSHILDFRFHDLRHTFASQLVMKSVDLATVRDLMGHKDIKMTLRYSHLSKTHLKEAVGALDKKFTTVLLPREETKNTPIPKPL